LGERRVRDYQIVFRGVCARQVVKQAGIDVNVLIDKLVRAASGARGLVLRVFERRPVGTFPARRAWLFALRKPLHDSGLRVNLPFYKAGRVDEIPPGHMETYFPKNVYPKDCAKLEEQLRPLHTYRVELRESELWVDLD
jgi:hypothetical protein